MSCHDGLWSNLEDDVLRVREAAAFLDAWRVVA
jgi:hypothetical protein